jgi:cysteine synthase A
MTVVVFVESNVSGSGFQSLRLADEQGLRVVFLTRGMDRYLRVPGAARIFDRHVAEVVHCETNDPSAVVAAVRELTPAPAAVLAVGEYHVAVAAEAARRLGLPGAEPLGVRTARDKLLTRRRCAAEGVPVPHFEPVCDPASLPGAARSVGLPCVVKPVDGSASEQVRLCATEEDLAAAWAGVQSVPYNAAGQRHQEVVLVEEYLEGPEVSVETVTACGETTVVGVTDKHVSGSPHFVETGHRFPSTLPPATVQACGRTAEAALRAIGMDLGVCHTELRVVRGVPHLIEVNARPAGDRITDLVELASGVSLLEQCLRVHLGDRPQLAASRRRGAAIRFLVADPGVVRCVDGARGAAAMPGVTEVAVAVRQGDPVRRLTRNGDRLGHVITEAADAATADVLAGQAAAAIRIETLREH